jgi:hypothetical protein
LSTFTVLRVEGFKPEKNGKGDLGDFPLIVFFFLHTRKVDIFENTYLPLFPTSSNTFCNHYFPPIYVKIGPKMDPLLFPANFFPPNQHPPVP